MAKGKFSTPRTPRGESFPPAEPVIADLPEDLEQELLLHELTQEISQPKPAPRPDLDATQVMVLEPEAAPEYQNPAAPVTNPAPAPQPRATQPEPQQPMPEEISPQVKKNKKIAIISLCCAALLILAGIVTAVTIVLRHGSDDGLILNNVTAAGVNLGGMTQAQAEEALRIATSGTYTQQDMVIHLPGDTITLPASQTGAKLDVEAVAEAAYLFGRTGSKSEKEAAREQAAKGTYHIALLSYMELDTEYIRKTIEDYCKSFNSDFQESSYKLEGTAPALSGDKFSIDAPCQTLILNPGTSGRHLDATALYNQVLDAYSFNQFSVEVDESALGDDPTPLDLEAIWKELTSDPVDASYDTDNKAVIPEVYGYTFDLAYARELLSAAEPGTTVGVPMKYVEPDLIGADYFADELSAYETKHTSNENRNNNLRLACAAINNYILLPGETFDYNQALGKRTTEAGYKAAAAYSGGETIQEIGGGICQVSSTLYYCALMADLEIVTREAHSYVSSYIPYGMDATVSWNGPEFRFRNNTDYPIRIEAEVADGYVRIRIVGTDTKDYYVDMEYEIVGWEDYETIYQEYAPNNEKGYKDGQVITTPYAGCTVKTYRCYYDKTTDELISRNFEAKSKYKTRDQVIAKIVQPETPTQAPETDSSTDSSTDTPADSPATPPASDTTSSNTPPEE